MSVCYCYVRDSRMYRLVPPTWKGDDSSRGAEGKKERGRGVTKRRERGKESSRRPSTLFAAPARSRSVSC